MNDASDRILVPGLVAGLIYNLGETLSSLAFQEPLRRAAEAHALREPGAGGVAVFVAQGFVTGVVLAWLYAALRRRLGAGPRTALAAAGTVWYLASFGPNVAWIVFGLVPLRLGLAGIATGLLELSIAALAAARLARPPSPPPADPRTSEPAFPT